MKKHIVFLYIKSPSRLSHIRKIATLKEKYTVTIIHAKVSNPDYIQHFCHHAIGVSSENTIENFTGILDKLSHIPAPDGIVNLSEPFLPIHSRLCQHFGLLGPSEMAVSVGRNKYNMRKFARELDIPIPGFVEVTSKNLCEAQSLDFPVVVKPVVGSGSTLVKRFESFEELERGYSELSHSAEQIFAQDSQVNEVEIEDYPFIVEEIIGGEVLFNTQLPVTIGEISVESVYANGEVTILAIHDKPLPNNGPYFEEVGYSTPSRIPQDVQDKAEAIVGKIHRALGEGSFVLHTEFRTFSDGPVLLEFGIRMGGAAIYNSLLASTGIDFIDVQVDIVLGLPIDIGHAYKIPTITQFLFPERQGKILAIKGEPSLVTEPSYVEHQIYDDVGDIAYRAPAAARSTMHVLFQHSDFPYLEQRVINAVNAFDILTEPEND
ncbi:acetyl-CoA carboxylase biotin carboxylase subunit family protein [Vibrio sp. NTOU-M3]|uniref:ATP-grasp domain-containing protein n=1 Tax=Vibrio sp. NTOU-M3 TaxID=3234954 RepID=UPI00349F2CEB